MSQPRLAPRDQALSYPRVTQDQKTRRAGKDAPRAKLKVERWREENPDHFCTWETKYGCVIQFWGMRVYYGRCKEEGCNGLVTTRRSIQGEHEYKFKTGRTMLGAYPSLCDNCRKRKQEESYTKNRKYAANYRRKLYERRGRRERPGEWCK
ncbi:hypothetical protein JHV675_50260 [Mycobacterium avium subsp. hominissuis]